MEQLIAKSIVIYNAGIECRFLFFSDTHCIQSSPYRESSHAVNQYSHGQVYSWTRQEDNSKSMILDIISEMQWWIIFYIECLPLSRAIPSLGSGPFYSSQYHLSRYPIDRDSPRDRDTPRLRYPSIAILGYNAISRSLVNTGIANGRISQRVNRSRI